MTSVYCLVVCSCPDEETAGVLAEGLVEGRLAACVNIVSGVRSVYRWQGVLEKSAECLLFAKTRASRQVELQTWLRARHPYELPEIIAIPIQSGLPEYLEWVGTCVTP
ncbi:MULTISPECIES: divalent-cation tolerance protein CutA [Methylococcus]|uniref:Divalent-cation tolerance protein CutA n=1 Tax=Methylococcus capsulatus TaxID=414 RepID=A0ABZ2F330_METCP|nr:MULTISPECIES: divalent-cation tolerance protein CutA [Methylococcus]MDF9392142.1 divalent-cation tolerance protein CutA [Methylococcus capsulatus]